jgi:hypothetical protein
LTFLEQRVCECLIGCQGAAESVSLLYRRRIESVSDSVDRRLVHAPVQEGELRKHLERAAHAADVVVLLV